MTNQRISRHVGSLFKTTHVLYNLLLGALAKHSIKDAQEMRDRVGPCAVYVEARYELHLGFYQLQEICWVVGRMVGDEGVVEGR